MTSINRKVNIEGVGLISGQYSLIELLPADSGSGVVFVNPANSDFFTADTDHILDTTHGVILGSPSFQVRIPEHLMATLSLLGITDIKILVYNNEIPVCDGSAADFYNLLKDVTTEKISIQHVYKLQKPLYFSVKHTSITALPAENFRISYAVNYINSPFSYSWYKWEYDKDLAEDLINARTFGYVKDLPLYQAQGLAMGVTPENTIGLNDDGTLTTDLRYNNEPIRHKILDVIGDLYLAGLTPYELNAHIIVIECGHYQHIQMARLIKEQSFSRRL